MSSVLTLRDRRRFVRLFEAFPGLGDGLEAGAVDELGSEFVCPVATIPTGRLDRAGVMSADVRGQISAAVVVDGLVDARWPVGRRSTLQIHGPGEFIDLEHVFADDTPAVACAARTPVTLALVDDRLAGIVARQPTLAGALLRWQASQTTLSQAYSAVMQLSRVEDRLLAVLESFAVRWGRMTPAGVEVVLDVTHGDLGQIVGAARSTVSLGVQRLLDSGAVRIEAPGRWTLDNPAPHVLPESHRGTLPIRAAVSVLRHRIQA